MNIAFFSSFISPHIKPFCDYLYSQPDVNFEYIQTIPITDERKRMGYDQNDDIPYLLTNLNLSEMQTISDKADCVIINTGSADTEIVKTRIINNGLTFFCNERLFKKGIIKYADLRLWKQWQLNCKSRGKRVFLLCIGQFTRSDFQKVGFNNGGCFKFGYFPKIESSGFNIDDGVIRILWVGRMINWKRPEIALKIATELKKKNINFYMDIIGDGPLYNKLESMCSSEKLYDTVKLHGLVDNDIVRHYMSNSDVLIVTSNRQEGWGAVVNEALSVGTPVIAFNSIGAANYLIQDGINGYLCDENNITDMINKIIEVKGKGSILRDGALKTIEEWNYRVAGDRFLKVVEKISKNYKIEDCYYHSGPFSKA